MLQTLAIRCFMTQLPKEEIKKILQRWTGNNFQSALIKLSSFISARESTPAKRDVYTFISKEKHAMIWGLISSFFRLK
jgi:hypothetical protein